MLPWRPPAHHGSVALAAGSSPILTRWRLVAKHDAGKGFRLKTDASAGGFQCLEVRWNLNVRATIGWYRLKSTAS